MWLRSWADNPEIDWKMEGELEYSFKSIKGLTEIFI